MKKIVTLNKVYIKDSKILNAGRGVFAAKNIKKGELIEKCPVIKIPKHDLSNLKESILATYFFFFGKRKEELLVALGFGSIYNHTYKPNARYIINSKDETMDFIAINAIKKNDEITINYNSASIKPKNPLWFEV